MAALVRTLALSPSPFEAFGERGGGGGRVALSNILLYTILHTLAIWQFNS